VDVFADTINQGKMNTAPPLEVSQYNALHDFYNATNGPSWKWTNSSISVPWNFSDPDSDPCEDHWQGLNCHCSSASCSITEIILDHHHLAGYLPTAISSFPELKKIMLRNNNISGSLPTTIGYIPQLDLLDLSFNYFTGFLPFSMELLTNLTALNLDSNFFTGISESFWKMTNLEVLTLSTNRLKGNLSASIGNLTSLKVLELFDNLLITTIPPTIGALEKLQLLNIGRNTIIPPFPSSLFALSNLSSFLMAQSDFGSTFPAEFANLSALSILDLSSNRLYGTLPDGLWNMSSLLFLSVNNNLLSGTVSCEIRNLSSLILLFLEYNSFYGAAVCLSSMRLELLYMAGNFFTGTYPMTSYQFSFLQYFEMQKNLFTGMLPWVDNLVAPMNVYNVDENYLTGNLPYIVETETLYYFICSQNYLTGKMTDNFLSETEHLYFLAVNNNLLTGTVPASFGNLTYLSQLSVSSNFLTGSIPYSLSQLRKLVVLDVSSNELTGSVPSSFTDLHVLEELLLHDNNLGGKLDTFLNSSSLSKLVNVDVSSNEFSGTLSGSFFANTKLLQSFAASSNCLIGSLPEQICEAKTLLSLSLDGLSTANNCRQTLFPGIPYFNAFTVSHFLQGSIPVCYYEMPSIQLLHLSGNGFSGTIASGLILSSSLTELSLSHNLLSGTIPSVIQERSWVDLDLSYNKLTGILGSSFSTFPSNGSLSLQVNRLSGTVPASLICTENITILDGNLFECDLLRNNIPQRDSDYSNYSCGSDEVDYVLYAWIASVFGFPVIFFVGYLMFADKLNPFNPLSKVIEVIQCWRNSFYPISSEEKVVSTNEINRICSTSKKVNIWRLALYFREMRSVALYLSIFCAFILLPTYSSLKISNSSYQLEYVWTVSAMFLQGEVAAGCLFAFLSVFAILTVYLFRRMIRRIDVKVRKPSIADFSSLASSRSKELRKSLLIYSVVGLVNLSIMSASDFSYVYMVLSSSSTISTLAALGLALFRLVTNNLLLWYALPYTTRLLSSDGPSSLMPGTVINSFHYSLVDVSFLESLMLINNIVIPFFAVVFILPDCFYNALFAAPDVESTYTYVTCRQYFPEHTVDSRGHLCIPETQQNKYSPPFIYSFQCSSKIVINYVAVYVLMFTMVGLVIPCLNLLVKWQLDRSAPTGLTRKCLEMMICEYFKPLKEVQGAVKITLFSKLRFTVQVNSYLTILLSFGALFPPLAVIAGLSIFSVCCFEELSIGRLLIKSKEAGYNWYEEQIENECAGVEESGSFTVWSTLFVSCCLYAYIIFDTMGNTEGWASALPMTLIMICFPLILFLIVRFSMVKRFKFFLISFSTKGAELTRSGRGRTKSDDLRASQIQMTASVDYPIVIRNPVIIDEV
jgi:Leucine-rich repeat (LRR) protein